MDIRFLFYCSTRSGLINLRKHIFPNIRVAKNMKIREKLNLRVFSRVEALF